MTVDHHTSSVISFVRFPLAVMVVYIHYFGSMPCDFSQMSPASFSELDLYNVIRVGMTYTLCQVAVPAFFLISGFLFFQKLSTWDWNIWKGKIHRRVYTLLIPYLLWNILRLLFNIATDGYHIFHSQGAAAAWLWISSEASPISLWTAPGSNLPLHSAFWFIRDLMVMVALSPVFYLLIKKRRTGILFLMALGAVYCTQLLPMLPDHSIPGFSITALLFFNIGGYMAVHHIITPPVATSLGTRMFVYTGFLVLVVAGIASYPNGLIHRFVMPWVVIMGIPSVFLLASSLVSKGKQLPTVLGDSSFFVYAFHMFIIISLRILSDKIGFDREQYPWLRILLYLAVPFLTSLLCAYIYAWLCVHAPRLCGLLTGRHASIPKQIQTS